VTEPDVALTDFALAIECAAFTIASVRRTRPAFVAVFALSAVASLLGGIVHGFASEADSPVYRVLWPSTVIAIVGAAAAMGVAAAAIFGWGPSARRAMLAIALALVAFVAWGHDDFYVAIAAYVPASVLLAAAFVTRRAWLGVFGLGLAMLAGALQQAGFSPIPRLTHNAFYHLLQMAALALLFVGARRESPEQR